MWVFRSVFLSSAKVMSHHEDRVIWYAKILMKKNVTNKTFYTTVGEW